MNFLYTFQIFVRELVGQPWFRNEESVVGIPSRVLLRLKQSVGIPERLFDEIVGQHFSEAHLQEDLTVRRTNFHEQMKVSGTVT